MNGEKLFAAMQELDDGILAQAAFYSPRRRPARFSKRTVAILAAALLLTACAAYVAIEWDSIFTGYFQPSEAALEQTKNGVQAVAASTEYNGYTFTVRQTLGDEQTIYLVLDITFPESIPLAQRLTKDAMGEWNPSIMPEGIMFYRGKTEQSQIAGMDKAALYEYFAGRELSASSQVGTSFSKADLESNTISYLLYQSAWGGPVDPKEPCITMVIQNLREYTSQPGRGDILAQGPFAVCWQRTNSGVVHEMEISDGEQVVGKVILSGFKLDVALWNLANVSEIKPLQETIHILMKDGTSFAHMGGEGSASHSTRDGKIHGAVDWNWIFREILPLDEVDSVVIGGYTVKVP